MVSMSLTGIPYGMRISESSRNKIKETLSSERNSMLISLAVNYMKRFEEAVADLDLGTWNKPNILVTTKFPKWKGNIHDDIMEMETDLCFEPEQEGHNLMKYFYEQLGEDVKHFIKKMTVIPGFKDFSATFRFELYPVTDIYFKDSPDRVEKLENENKKLRSEVNRLSAENYNARIQRAFSKYEDACDYRMLSTQVKKIVSNPKKRTTVILWKNGDKIITKAMKGEKFDAEKGIAMAFMKYAYGNNGAYMKEIRKAIAKDPKIITEDQKTIVEDQKAIAEDQK